MDPLNFGTVVPGSRSNRPFGRPPTQTRLSRNPNALRGRPSSAGVPVEVVSERPARTFARSPGAIPATASSSARPSTTPARQSRSDRTAIRRRQVFG
jgi:hypothetical protein